MTFTALTPDTGNGVPPTIDECSESVLFRRWTMKELLAEPDEFEWLIKGMLCHPTYGQIAGELKSLKTYLDGMIQVGVAAGVPILGRFEPGEARPVLAYVGEGGRQPYLRRLRRIAEALNVRLDDLPLELVSDVAPIQSAIFGASLDRDLADMKPALVCLDPYYAYHGAGTKASDLHQEGALLSQLSARCLDAGANLLVVNHMNQTGSGMDLKRITMAGSGEWVDSWILLAHRNTPDVDAGKFTLRMDIGSRQWGGTSWDLDLDIGHFDEDRGSHDGPITWTLNRAAQKDAGDAGRDRDKTEKYRRLIVDVLDDQPWLLTKTEVLDRVGGNRDDRRKAFGKLADEGVISHNKVGRTEAGTTKQRVCWAHTTNPAQLVGPGWFEDPE